MIIKSCPHFKNEKEFTHRYGGNIRDNWWFWHKISDVDSRLKPFDAVTCVNGKSTYIEIKVGNEKESCNVYNKLRPNQIFWLRLVAKNWGEALVIYYNKIHDIYVTMKFEPETTNLMRKKIL